MKQRILMLVTGILVSIGVLWCLNLKDPHLLPIRQSEYVLFLVFALFILGAAMGIRRRAIKAILVVCTITLVTMASVEELRFRQAREAIRANLGGEYSTINRRLIIGFNDKAEIKQLVANDIAGVFLTGHNIKGETRQSLTAFLAELQQIRADRGLAPLIVATDQEGGPVSRLSPLLPHQPALATVQTDRESSYLYGYKQGLGLRDIGVTVNFSPVVDLKPEGPPGALDFHSLIATRAISADPAEVVQIAKPYIQGLEAAGITATLKHFPGLARVPNDTHHFSARLTTDKPTLLTSDWVPFIKLSQASSSWLMLSHVILTAIDPDNPVSTSSLVVEGLIRSELGITNPLVTDDLTMGATYNRGFCKSVFQSYSTDIDYLLIAYDYEKYYAAVECIQAHRKTQ
ncbi:glycoside hydrolase family 3 N-terminal domain-containing protein [Pseudomonas neustonica]|uniref:glycoside hydrolase family 3 N-terminal domain-containing protein n=1 Tax=Pseudomonas neustonica TaxID=2487346 RepID=UPI003F45D27D